jgi:hypothetical protein
MTRGLDSQSPANVSFHLKGIDFPANRGDLVKQAGRNDADNDVLEIIKHMPDDEYENMADVMKAYGEVRHSE